MRFAVVASIAALALSLQLPTLRPKKQFTRVAVLGGGFAGLTAARTLAANPQVEVLLVDQRECKCLPAALPAAASPGLRAKPHFEWWCFLYARRF